jgi:hypothetical protein
LEGACQFYSNTGPWKKKQKCFFQTHFVDPGGISSYNIIMREWQLQSGDPLSLNLAADARLGKTDYCNDHIWELIIRGGEPPALAVQTTFGLRARGLKIFPRFSEGDLVRSDPETFTSPPQVRCFAPNYLQLEFSPLSGLEASAEYWVPESHALAGRIRVSNTSHTARSVLVELTGLLTPIGDGQRMAPAGAVGAPVLAGSSGGLHPVVVLSGGAEIGSGPYPSLALTLLLHPGESRQVIWAHAARESFEDSLSLARNTCSANWEALQSRIDMQNSGQVEISTGDLDWDAAFALAQKNAYGLLVGPTAHLPHISFVNARQPSHGFSLRGDGQDYSHLWSGQTPLDTWYLAGLLLPASPQIVQGLVANFLHTLQENGSMDWKPGLGGQRSKLHASPLLAQIALACYQTSQDLDFLKESFPALVAYVKYWFSPAMDRDQDGIPEWTHPLHSGLEDSPSFSYWQPWSHGLDIFAAEAPALCAFLYQEIQALVQIGEMIGERLAQQDMASFAENLRIAVEISWEKEASIYRYWDRDSHSSPRGMLAAEFQGSGIFPINSPYDQPVRLLFKIMSETAHPPRPQIAIHGTGPNGQHLVEPVQPSQFHWQPGMGTTTSQRVYQELEFISVDGLGEQDTTRIYTADFQEQDCTLLLPLWAGIPSEERAAALIHETITSAERYWKPFGIPSAPQPPAGDEGEVSQAVHLPWNCLIGEGLLRYGYRQEAAELVSRLMQAAVTSLKKDQQFKKTYHAQTGNGMGEANALEGLAPVGLFLNTLGVHLFSHQRVGISGFNPFPRPITVKYRGMTITRESDRTVVTFPDGQTTTITEPDPCYVLLE